MINIRTLQCNPIQENCFILSDETGEAAVIDCGAFFEQERQAVVSYLQSNQLTLRHVLCTHAHFDHIFGVNTLYDEFGIQPRLHRADEFLYSGVALQTQAMMGFSFDLPMPPLGPWLEDGELIRLGSHQLKVLHTPGHSPGSVLFYIEDEKVLFSGDTLFRMSVGRTDLEGGSWQQLIESLARVVAPLPADTRVYTGHGPATLIGDEVKMNPYFR
ncbi:MAG: MBL fold metallo-hydrolase [Prevotella sp.]|jgi:glyoxylase-like metal-dependent hydrolase (beta-lactamase superfamily II)|nr:MBL fold metallo-hydrolase [Prevotella sp.]